jgi:hypothetical protein
MNNEENFYLKVADSEISISEEQYDRLSLMAYNARMDIEQHIRKRYRNDSDGEIERIDTTISLTEDQLLFCFKTEF